MQEIHDRLDRYEPGQFKNKFKILFIVVSISLTLIVMRLWYLQVIMGDELRQRSENNSVRLRKIQSMRGLILDAGRQVLVDNQPSFDLVFVPDRTRDVNATIEKIRTLYAKRSLTLSSLNSYTGKVKPLVPSSSRGTSAWKNSPS